MNILLADDDMDDCLFFEEGINELPDMHLATVHDGEQLMELLTNETSGLPDVLFLDINMPRKNGFECLYEIKFNEKLKQIPVVIFSTSLEQDVVNLLYKNGAQYFIRKPPDFSLFKNIIHHTIDLLRQKPIIQTTREDFVLTVESNLIL